MGSITRVKFAILFLTVGFLWTQTSGQYETPNDWCGGYLRYIRGSINFNFNNSTTNATDPEKICVWTVAPTKQYINFLITNMTLPNMACTDFSVTINALEDRARGISSSVRYCAGNTPTLPHLLKGTVMVVILRVRSVQTVLGQKFYLAYKQNNESDWNGATQLINTYYSFGRPSIDPLPYFAAGFMSNGMSTFAFPKANFSSGTNYEFQLSFDTIKFGSRQQCNPPFDFLMLSPISSTGALGQPIIFDTNRTSTEIYRSGFGFFMIYWGGRNCSIGGGGSIQMYYESVRIA